LKYINLSILKLDKYTFFKIFKFDNGD